MSGLAKFFDTIKKSIFDFSSYREIGQKSFWSAYKYQLLFLSVFVIIKCFQISGIYLVNRPHIQPSVNQFLASAQNFYPGNLKIKIENGQLSTNQKEPYIFDAYQKLNHHLLVIDTKGSIENYPNYNTYILATKNALVYPSQVKNNVQQTSVFYFQNMTQNVTLDKNVYLALLEKVKPYALRAINFVDSIFLALLFLYLVLAPLFWSSSIMTGLFVLIFLVWLVNLIFRKGFGYWSLYKMGMYAVTLPVIINEIFKLFSVSIPGSYSLLFLLFMMVVIFS
ncbi:DUF1189 domain-containing protein [Patescibacteria group bacterium]|nr:DUF1189 domain-containing protein [Patescibacteria group bacterium]